MNSSLLGLTASATPATAPVVTASGANSAQTSVTTDSADSDTSSPFAQLLELAASEQWSGATGEVAAENGEFQGSGEESDVGEADALAPVAGAIVLPLTELNPVAVVEANPADSTTDIAAAAEAAAVVLSTTTESAPSALETEPVILPLAGKDLPSWQGGNVPTVTIPGLTPRLPPIAEHAESKLAGLSTPAIDTGVADASLEALSDAKLTEGWAQLLENASKLGAPPRSDNSWSPVNRTGAELIAALTPSANPTASVVTSHADSVPGIALRSPHFASLLGNQVLWQAKVGNHHAEIRLDPPELGPIEVRISQKDSETHLHFVVSHSATREQLEQAMPRLRELFGQGGLLLGQVAVEQGRRDGSSDQPQSHGSSTSKHPDDSLRSEESTAHRLSSTSLIDDYA